MLDYFRERFDIPSSPFDGFRWWGGQRAYGVIRESERLGDVAHLKIQTAGIILARDVSQYLKPTTQAVNMLGHLARRNIFELDRTTLEQLLTEGELPVACSDQGYVILIFDGQALGCGLSLPDRLVNQLPRWMKSQLLGYLRMGGMGRG